MRNALGGLFFLGLIAASAAPGSAQEVGGALPDSITASAATGTAANAAPEAAQVESYWGPIPTGEGAPRAVIRTRSAHPVEHAILAPFYIVTYPIFLTTRGLKEGLVFLDERGLLPRTGAALPIRIGRVAAGPALSYGGRAGFGAGGTIVVLGDREPADWIKLRYLATVNGMHRASAGLRAPWGREGKLEIGGGYRIERNARFYGLGPSSRKADRSYFTEEQHWAGAGYRRALGGPLAAEWSAIYTSIATRGPRPEDGPDLGVTFAAASPPGYGARSEGVLHGLLLRLDTTKETGRPGSGVLAQAQAGYFDPTGKPGGAFWRYSGEAGAFMPLWFTDRTLALRGAVSWIEAPGNGTVPFTRLVTNYSGKSLRGYGDYRWRDRGLLDLTAEYRWPVWALDRAHGTGVDAYAFVNSGQVFGEWRQVASRLLRTSWGGGFRAITEKGFGGRLEIARSSESTEIRLQADQMFDFKEIGLFGGNQHVAAD